MSAPRCSPWRRDFCPVFAAKVRRALYTPLVLALAAASLACGSFCTPRIRPGWSDRLGRLRHRLAVAVAARADRHGAGRAEEDLRERLEELRNTLLAGDADGAKAMLPAVEEA